MNITIKDCWLLPVARLDAAASIAIYLLKYNEMHRRFRLMEPDTQLLTRWEISPGGDVISLGFVDSAGEARTIRLTLNQVGALAMTLPGLIGKALQARYGDQTLRYAYPLESWAIEQSTDPTQGMVTLRTSDGFAVCFSIPREQQSQLGEALAAQYTPPAVRAN
jgi:hypothetical protein